NFHLLYPPVESCIVKGALELNLGINGQLWGRRLPVLDSFGYVTALNPYIGYKNATRIARIALESGRGVLELVREEGLLDEAMLADILRPENMIAPRLVPLKA
ncbi:hypothetical protein ACIP1Y_14130, partial [Pseudomonas atacamensis]